MSDRKGLRIFYGAILASCFYLSGCESFIGSVIENAVTPQKARDAEWKRHHQNPGIMIEEAERDAKAEHALDIQKQEKKDAAARKKQFDESLEKQLQSSR